MNTCSAFAVVVLLACVPIAAQSPAPSAAVRTQPSSVTEVRTLLRSSSLQDNAWGAWWAGERAMRELEPDLRATLRASLASSVEDFDREVAIDDALDALIRFGANGLPIDEIAAVYASRLRQAEALILLAQSSMPRVDADRFLLAAVRKKDGEWRRMNWFAAADLLLDRRTPGLAAAVLQDLRFVAHVLVCVRVDDCRFVAPGSGGSWSGGAPDASLPPWAHYSLMKPGSTGTLLVQGPTPETTMAYGRYLGLVRPPGPAQPPVAAECLTLIAAAAPRVTLPSIDGEVLRVETRGSGVYDDVVAMVRRELEGRYAGMLGSLTDAGLLTRQGAGTLMAPQLSITVEQGVTGGRP
jgi:hypothetical protein